MLQLTWTLLIKRMVSPKNRRWAGKGKCKAVLVENVALITNRGQDKRIISGLYIKSIRCPHRGR